jgi:mycofactocin system glycosyltransferase
MSADRFIVDTSWRRPARGRTVFAGSPIKLFTLGDAGKSVVEAIEHGQALPPGHEPLTSRLIDAGAIHPLVMPGDECDLNALDVTVVIPACVRNAQDALWLQQLVKSCSFVAAVIVVNDHSPHALPILPSAQVVNTDATRGPGAARNHGLQFVTTPLVACIDLDVCISPHTINELLGYFNAPNVGLVAPRVSSKAGTSLIEHYEMTRSPLDLGVTEARVRAGTRVSYVPSAMWLCRTAALREIGGFNESLNVGEDVDAVWRLDKAGWLCRYQPNAVCMHEPRTTLQQLLQQRVSYGSSAAPLAKKHRGALAPVRVSGYSAAMWALIVTGFPGLGALVGFGTVVALARKLRATPEASREALRLAGLGNVYAGKSLASAITRVWWPIAIILALVSRRAKVVLIASFVIPSMYDWWKKRPSIDPVRYTALRALDDGAYGVGVWKGVLREKSADALMPDLTSWPNSAR